MNLKLIVCLLCFLLTGEEQAASQLSSPTFTSPQYSLASTYSIVAWDSVTGDLGVAVRSNLLAVGAIVPFAKAGVGAIATQGLTNTAYGSSGLSMLEHGILPQQVVAILTKNDSGAVRRQIGIVDAHGNSFAYTGSACGQFAGHVTGYAYSVQGDGLKGESVIKAMARMFEITSGDLADRLLSALEAGEKEEGYHHGNQSAVIEIMREGAGYGGLNDRFIDLRVDDDSLPLVQLRRLYADWKKVFYFDAEMHSIAVFNQNKKFDVAREILQRVVNSLNQELRDKPDDPDVLSTVAWTLATNDIDKERALELAKRAAKLSPDKLQILNTLAECHFQLGHIDEAIAIESQLVSKDPTEVLFWKQLQKFKEAKNRFMH